MQHGIRSYNTLHILTLLRGLLIISCNNSELGKLDIQIINFSLHNDKHKLVTNFYNFLKGNFFISNYEFV